MELRGWKSGIDGEHIQPYTLLYEGKNGNAKFYEMFSRKKNIANAKDLFEKKADGIVMAVLSTDGEKILLEKEFRPAINRSIYNFPAGLIEEGENFITAARREVMEETGVTLVDVLEGLPPAYGLAALTNELTQFVIAKGEGEINGHPDEDEEIEAFWMTKEEVLRLLKTEDFSTRTQLFCYMWASGILDFEKL